MANKQTKTVTKVYNSLKSMEKATSLMRKATGTLRKTEGFQALAATQKEAREMIKTSLTELRDCGQAIEIVNEIVQIDSGSGNAARQARFRRVGYFITTISDIYGDYDFSKRYDIEGRVDGITGTYIGGEARREAHRLQTACKELKSLGIVGKRFKVPNLETLESIVNENKRLALEGEQVEDSPQQVTSDIMAQAAKSLKPKGKSAKKKSVKNVAAHAKANPVKLKRKAA